MRFKRLSLVVATLTLVLILSGLLVYSNSEQEFEETSSCTAIAVSPEASADGSSMTTHTDDSGTDTFHVSMIPAADYEPGTMRPVLKNTDDGPFRQLRDILFSPGEIPQVAHTYAYTNASYSFQNEMQVGMGESTIGGQRDLRNSDGWFEVVELQRIALERASTAREAIQIMGS
ncbi:unnamed protein product, partial [marine sediment metagenome]